MLFFNDDDDDDDDGSENMFFISQLLERYSYKKTRALIMLLVRNQNGYIFLLFLHYISLLE